jgi:hypothetical protein
MLLSEAQKYLEIVRKRGEANSELRRVYYNIVTNKELYLMAYEHLYANPGAMTPGIEKSDTVDGMSLKRIEAILEQLTNRTYTWKPTRRTYILKKDGKSKRSLGMPGWNDKMVQEVLRMVLEAYYEPQFRESSHGFRPHKGCHTVLREIRNESKKPLRAVFGKTPIHKNEAANIQDNIHVQHANRNQLIDRLLAEKCELCGRMGRVEGHHIKKLKDLKKRWEGRKEKPEWVKRMIAIHRKTLFVCGECHKKIHNGTYNGRKLT